MEDLRDFADDQSFVELGAVTYHLIVDEHYGQAQALGADRFDKPIS